MHWLYQVQRQHTAGAYIGIYTTTSHDDAVAYLAKIAAKVPSRPYDGGNKWQDSSNRHNVNRYRVVQII